MEASGVVLLEDGTKSMDGRGTGVGIREAEWEREEGMKRVRCGFFV